MSESILIPDGKLQLCEKCHSEIDAYCDECEVTYCSNCLDHDCEYEVCGHHRICEGGA